MRIKGNDGEWSKWSNIRWMSKEVNKNIDVNFIINVSKKIITLDYKIADSSRKFYTYNILSSHEDNSYKEFSFYALTMKVRDNDNNITDYILVYNPNCSNGYSYSLMATDSDSLMQRKFYVTEQ